MVSVSKTSAWVHAHDERWVRCDNAVVRYDHAVECCTSKPWLPGHRGWMAFSPGEGDNGLLGYFPRRWKRGGFSGMMVPRKFKSAEAAMRAVDREFPVQASSTAAAK